MKVQFSLSLIKQKQTRAISYISSYGALGEHERSVRVAFGVACVQTSPISFVAVGDAR